jgi:hypothetical protein
MESLQWFCLGVLSMLAAMGMVYVHMVINLRWYTIPLLILGVVLVLFGIAWAGSSLNEGYPSSSALGLTFFGGPGVIILLLTWRHLVVPGLKVKKAG